MSSEGVTPLESSPPDSVPGNDALKQISQVLVSSVILLVAVMVFTILLRHIRDRYALARVEAAAAEARRAAGEILGGLGYVHGMRAEVLQQPGLDEATIKGLGPVQQFSLEGRQDLEGGEKECAVCLAEYREGESCRRLDKCGHNFHQECIDAWLKSSASCPLCRVSLRPDLKLLAPHAHGSAGASSSSQAAAGPPPQYNASLFSIPGLGPRQHQHAAPPPHRAPANPQPPPQSQPASQPAPQVATLPV